MDQKYLCIGLHMESMFSTCCVKKVAEMYHFSSYTRCKWMCNGDDVNDCDVVVAGARIVARLYLQTM